MEKLKTILQKDVVYVYQNKGKKIIFDIGLYIVTIIGLSLSWYLTDYIVYSFATMPY